MNVTYIGGLPELPVRSRIHTVGPDLLCQHNFEDIVSLKALSIRLA